MQRLLRFAQMAACALLCTTAQATAQQYPTGPIRIVIGFAPGGATDVVFRVLAEELRTVLGQPVLVENKAGASGLIALEDVLQAKPDGHTLLGHNSTSGSALLVMKEKDKNALDPEKRLTVVSPVAAGPPTVIAAVKELPAANVADLIAHAKANPGKVRFASSGAQGGPHLDMVMLSKRAGIEMVHLPQRGAGGILTALSNRDAHIGMVTMATISGQVQNGDLKVLAVASPTRLNNLLNVPTLKEAGFPDVGNLLWHAFYAHSETPPAVIDTIFKATQKALKSERMQDLYKRTELAPLEMRDRAAALTWATSNLDTFKRVIAEVGTDAK